MAGKQQLAIFDLDGTLISGDSFRSLIVENILSRPRLGVLVGLRAARLLSREGFAKKAHKEVKPLLDNPDFVSDFLQSLEKRIFSQVLNNAKKRMAEGQKVVLISASPHEYAVRFSQQLGFDEGFGSDWRGGKYQHLYAKGKLDFALHHYPKEQFEWSYAISDSQSDSLLLNAFDEQEYWNGG